MGNKDNGENICHPMRQRSRQTMGLFYMSSRTTYHNIFKVGKQIFILFSLFILIHKGPLTKSKPRLQLQFCTQKKKKRKEKVKKKEGGADLGFVHEGVCRCIQMHAHGLADTCTHLSEWHSFDTHLKP